MGKNARIALSLQSGISLLAVFACGFAGAADVHNTDYIYPGAPAGHDPSELTAHSRAPKAGLTIISAAPAADAKFAARPSPYLHSVAISQPTKQELKLAARPSPYLKTAAVAPATKRSVKLAAHSSPSSHSVALLPPTKRELTLAARPSPYLHAASADSAVPTPKLSVLKEARYEPADSFAMASAEEPLRPSLPAPAPDKIRKISTAMTRKTAADAGHSHARTHAVHVAQARVLPPAEKQIAYDVVPPPKLVIWESIGGAPFTGPVNVPAAPPQALNVQAPVVDRRSAKRVKNNPLPSLADARPSGNATTATASNARYITAPAPARTDMTAEAAQSLPAVQTTAAADPVAAPATISRAAARRVAQGGGHVVIVGESELASMVQVTQQSTENLAAQASAYGAGVEMAMNEAHANQAQSLNALAPAAGAPQPTMTLPDMTALPATTALPAPASPDNAAIVTLPAGTALPAPASLPPVEQAPTPVVHMPAPQELPENPAGVAEMDRLSPQTKAIADSLPPERIKIEKEKPPVHIERTQKNPLDNEDVRKHEGVGMSISVRRPKPSVNHMLEEAYDDLIAGDQEAAIAVYKDVLRQEPDNKLALFGLATTYHRAGQLKMARPLYGKLLAIDPQNAEGLNNFLVLLSDESPVEGIEEMKKLERTHPDFSPLPAQMAVVYEKMGQYDEAVLNMRHAIELSPENIKYRYDMAVILDKMGDWENAGTYYQQLITADERGEKIPARAQEIQERLTFIRSNKPQAQ